ncbi:MAG: hypothetical protein CM15mP77_3410 [Synechococcus sp.]|nr:MAG: hypothetical protein CM15mP77_3410 [Synechococcus sp.]
MQLAGRAGRGERPGQVLVQTYCPEHPVIRHLVDGRYEDFLAQEVQLRREAALVPFSRACLLRLSGESASATARRHRFLAERVRPLSRSWLVVTGAGPCPGGPGGWAQPLAAAAPWSGGIRAAASPWPDPLGRTSPRCGLAVDPDPLEL